jgi:hypothetical protein
VRLGIDRALASPAGVSGRPVATNTQIRVVTNFLDELRQKVK